jgi:hypothetical protein
MEKRTWPWLVAGMLLIASGASAGAATFLWWIPCRGAMLSGSLIYGFQQGPAGDFTSACLQRMDEGGPSLASNVSAATTPGEYELGVAAVLLAGLAWLVLVVGLRWTRPTRRVALPLALVLIVWAGTALSPIGRSSSVESLTSVAVIAMFATDIAAGCAAVVVATRWELERSMIVRGWIAVWGVASFGLIRLLLDYGFFAAWSEADWDAPPGTGYTCAAAPVIAGVAIMALALRDRWRAGRRVTELRVPVSEWS